MLHKLKCNIFRYPFSINKIEMKTSQLLFVLCSLFATVFAFPVLAQDESDDLYFNSKDLKKKREEAKILTSQPKPSTYQYSTPSSDVSEDEPAATEENNRFNNDPNYTNKYIEASKNDSKIVQNATTINNNYYYNGQPASTSTSSPTAGWYDNNPYKLRRRARGSRWNITPVISWNNWSGVGFGMSGSWNSGWNNGFGWNSPYYNSWNSSYYGYGYGINNGFGGCWGWGDPYYNNYYGYNSGYSYGNNSWVGANNWGWNIYNPYSYGNYGYGYGNYGYGGGFGYNQYYGWRPTVYVPVTYTAPKVNYGPIQNNSNVTNTSGYGSNGNGNGNLVRPGTPSSSQQRIQNGNQTPAQELARPRERYSPPQQTNPTINSSQQNNSRNDSYSAPQGFRGYDNNNGGSNFGSGRSSQRSENGFGGGGNTPNGGGGGGGGLARPR
jgi:hypothetical protein